jgi:hypothetical protein
VTSTSFFVGGIIGIAEGFEKFFPILEARFLLVPYSFIQCSSQICKGLLSLFDMSLMWIRYIDPYDRTAKL